MPYAEVEPDEIKARLARGEDVFLLDVREPDEVEAWAYPIGVNIPLGQLGDRLDELPDGRTIVVACHVGGRSAAAAQALSEAGWTAENLTGGAVAWVAGAAGSRKTPANRDGTRSGTQVQRRPEERAAARRAFSAPRSHPNDAAKCHEPPEVVAAREADIRARPLSAEVRYWLA